MQYLSSVARGEVAAAEGEFCAGSVAAGKKTAPASNRLIEVSARVRIMSRALPPANSSHARADYTQRMPPYNGIPAANGACSLAGGATAATWRRGGQDPDST